MNHLAIERKKRTGLRSLATLVGAVMRSRRGAQRLLSEAYGGICLHGRHQDVCSVGIRWRECCTLS